MTGNWTRRAGMGVVLALAAFQGANAENLGGDDAGHSRHRPAAPIFSAST